MKNALRAISEMISEGRYDNAQLALASLINAADEPNEPAPAPAMAYYQVEFQVFLADGGTMTVLAANSDEARAQAVSLVERGDYDKNPEVQEVCIQSCVLQKV